MSLKQSSLEDAIKAYLQGDKNVHVVVKRGLDMQYMLLSDLLEDVCIAFVDESMSQDSKLPQQSNQQNEADHKNSAVITTNKVTAVKDDISEGKIGKISTELCRDGKELKVPPSLTNSEEKRRNKQSRKLKIDLGKLFALKQAGWSRAQVADDLDVSYQTVLKYWNKEKEYLAGEL